MQISIAKWNSRMKKIIAVSLLSLISSAAMASDNGFYVSAKMGTSVVQLSNQKWETIEQSPYDYQSHSSGSKNKAVFGGGLAFGYDLYDTTSLPIRAELDFSMRGKASSNYNIGRENITIPSGSLTSSDDVKNDVTLNTFMVNAYYDFKNETNFTPYVSVGLGMANIKHKAKYEYTEIQLPSNITDNNSFSKSKTSNNFAWSLGLGSQYKLNDNLSLDLSYRFLDAGKSTVSHYEDEQENKSKVKVRTNDVMFGVIYRF